MFFCCCMNKNCTDQDHLIQFPCNAHECPATKCYTRTELRIIMYLLLLLFRYGSRLRRCGDAAEWQCDIVAMWHCGSAASWQCGMVAVRQSPKITNPAWWEGRLPNCIWPGGSSTPDFGHLRAPIMHKITHKLPIRNSRLVDVTPLFDPLWLIQKFPPGQN